MRAVSVALLLEEQRGGIVEAWRREVERELGGEAALAFAVGPLLREMALALRGDPSPLRAAAAPAEAAGARCAVLVRSGAAPARIAREFKLLHRAVWHELRRAGAVVGADDRRAGDEWLDDALAAALERQDRLRARGDLAEGAAAPARPPPLPALARAAALAPERGGGGRAAPRPHATPPPAGGARPPPLPPVIAARPPPLPRAPQRPPPVPDASAYVID